MSNDKTGSTNYWPLILLSVGVVGLFFASWWWLTDTINDSEKQGQFGDQFGAVNALFSGLAFAGLIFTIILQKKELALQREELSQTREELKGQKEQLTEQNKTLKIQRFENTFFNMMELQQQIVNDLSIKDYDKVTLYEECTPIEGGGKRSREELFEKNIKGRNLFYSAFLTVQHNIKIHNGNWKKFEGMIEVLSEVGFYKYIECLSPTFFDHYFRHFYTILKFIDKNENLLNEEEQYEYAKILRATLSRYELVWLYYNGLSDYGNKKLKLLIERYSMLNNIREDLLTLCKENMGKIVQLGLTVDDLKAKGFSGTDYEFFLTTEWGDKTKYHLSAFYKSVQKQEEGRKLVTDWNNYLEERYVYTSNQ